MEPLLLEALADVLVGAEDGIVGALAGGGLEEGVDQPLPPGDILLVVRHVVVEPAPSVPRGLLALVEVSCHHPEAPRRDPPMVRRRAPLLQASTEEGGGRRRRPRSRAAEARLQSQTTHLTPPPREKEK